MYRRILVPLDGSPLAEAVLPYAEDLARSTGAELVFLRVTPNPVAEIGLADPTLVAGYIEEVNRLEAEATRKLETLCSELESAGFRASFLVREGLVAETIMDVAKFMEADVIAMSTHGRSGISRWLLGSVADRIVNHSEIPVLLIRPKTP